MAILNNPMGALAAVDARGSGSVVAIGPTEPAVALAAGKGNHEMYTCCGLCGDIMEHMQTFDRLYGQAMASLSTGDYQGFLETGLEAQEEYFALGDARDVFAARCGELTDENCAKHCATPPLVS